MNKTIENIVILICVTIIWVALLITITITSRDDEKIKLLNDFGGYDYYHIENFKEVQKPMDLSSLLRTKEEEAEILTRMFPEKSYR